MNAYEEQLRSAVEAATVESPTIFSWFGRRSSRLPAPSLRALTPATARNYLLYALEWHLYQNFYICGYPSPQRPLEHFSHFNETNGFVEELSMANGGHGPWERGWRVKAVEADFVVVSKDSLDLRVQFDECRPTVGHSMEAGILVGVRFPKELLGISPGYYMALGNLPLTDGQGTLLRFYWHLSVADAVPFLGLTTKGLNESEVPFRAKVVRHPAGFTRCDAAVVYVPRASVERAVPVLRQTHRKLSQHMAEGVPGLTKRLGRGLGFAEDPIDGLSFGLARCRLIAEGLISAFERSTNGLDARYESVQSVFAERGVEVTRPYLNQGSSEEPAAFE